MQILLFQRIFCQSDPFEDVVAGTTLATALAFIEDREMPGSDTLPGEPTPGEDFVEIADMLGPELRSKTELLRRKLLYLNIGRLTNISYVLIKRCVPAFSVSGSKEQMDLSGLCFPYNTIMSNNMIVLFYCSLVTYGADESVKSSDEVRAVIIILDFICEYLKCYAYFLNTRTYRMLDKDRNPTCTVLQGQLFGIKGDSAIVVDIIYMISGIVITTKRKIWHLSRYMSSNIKSKSLVAKIDAILGFMVKRACYNTSFASSLIVWVVKHTGGYFSLIKTLEGLLQKKAIPALAGNYRAYLLNIASLCNRLLLASSNISILVGLPASNKILVSAQETTRLEVAFLTKKIGEQLLAIEVQDICRRDFYDRNVPPAVANCGSFLLDCHKNKARGLAEKYLFYREIAKYNGGGAAIIFQDIIGFIISQHLEELELCIKYQNQCGCSTIPIGDALVQADY